MFSRLDTVILRVRDLAAAQQWYATTLGLHSVFEDSVQRLAVLGLDGGSLTLWELPGGEAVRPSSTFPIFGVTDAHAAHAHLREHGAAVEPVAEGPGVRYVRFADPDGNPLEACQVLPADAVPATADLSATD